MQNFHARPNRRSHRVVHGRAAALAIRLRRNASFQEKLRQLIIKMLKEKRPQAGALPNQDELRWQQF
jgi:hypothetical protein